MEFNIDFTEVDAPSGKQIDIVQDICSTLDISPPQQYTRGAYSDFISDNIEEFKDAVWAESASNRYKDGGFDW